MTADHTPERRCTHPKPEFRWDGKQWGWTCPLCSTQLVLLEAADLADHTPERLTREGLGRLLDRLLIEHWPNSGVNPWYLADLIREHDAAHLADVEALADEWAADPDGLPRADVCARKLRAALHPDPKDPA